MDELISIIVPIYNAEKYLKKCLDSLIIQSYENIEIILIDDGSTDSSAEICHVYLKKDKRIKYIFQNNAGVSKARNVGISYATGKYILFVDSDDYVLKDYVKSLFEVMDGSELSVCGYYLINSSNDIINSSVKGQRRNLKLKAEEYMYSLFSFNEFSYQGYICSKLFKRSIILNENIQFEEDIKYNEDRLFVLKYVLCCKNVAYNDEPLYMYKQHDESVMSAIKKGYSPDMMTELFAFEKMLYLLNKKNKKIYAEALFNACYAVASLKKIVNNKQDKRHIKKIQRRWSLMAIINRNICFKNKAIILFYFFQG